MELSRKKQIKRRLLPGFANGLDYAPLYDLIRDRFNQQSAVNQYTVPLNDRSINFSPWFGLASLAGSGIAKGIGAIEKSNLLITNAGTSNGNIGGIGYTMYNAVDPNKIMRDYDNDTLLSFVTNPFEGITRLFGRNKQKREAAEAAILSLGLTRNNRAGAQTDALLLNYGLAARGKDESDTNVLPEVQNLYDAGALPLVTVSGKRRKSTGTYNTSSKSMLPSLSEMLKDNLQYLFMKDFGMLNNDDYLSYMHYNMLKNPRGRLLMPYFKYEDGKDLDGYTYNPELDNLVITPTEELNSIHKQNRKNIKNAKQFLQDWISDRFWRNYDKTKKVLNNTDDPNYIKGLFEGALKRYTRSLEDLSNAIILTPDSEDDAFLYGTTKEQMLKNFEDEENTHGYYDPLSTKYGRPVIYLRNSSMDPSVVLHELTHASGLAYTDTPYTDYPNMDVGRESYIKDDVKWRLNLNNRYYNYLTGNDEPTARLSVLRKYLKDAGYDLHPDRDMTELELDAILNDSNIMNDQKVKDMNIFNMFYNGKQYDKKALLDFMNTAYTNPLIDVYRARRGKDNRMLMNSNSLVKRGESVLSNLNPLNPQETTGTVVKQGSGRKDDVPANLGLKDIVLGEDIDWRTGSTFKQQALPYTIALEHINNKYENNGNDLSSLSKPTQRLQLEQVNRLKQPIVEKLKDLADQLKYLHDVTGYNQTFMAANGKDYHTIPNALGALASIGQMIQAGKQSIKTSNSYAPNKYAGRALNTLASLDINEQPGLQQINKAARYADYGVNNSGGLSGSQKYLGRLANANNMYTNYLKFLWDSQALRNAYKAQYANALATIGAQEAQNRLNANQWDLDYYSKAHAAKLGGIQMGLRNLMDYANQWSADASKRYQFNKMYGLYAFDTYNNANKYR